VVELADYSGMVLVAVKAAPSTVEGWVNLAYLVAAVLFILTFKLLAHPRTAVRGNLLGAIGMTLAVGATFFDPKISQTTGTYSTIAIAMAIGAVAGVVLATKIPMTGMPQMVGLLNGFGGGASLLVAGAELHAGHSDATPPLLAWDQPIVATALSGLIGAVTFWGSMVAFAKLQEIKQFQKPLVFPMQQALNALLGVICILLCWWLIADPEAWYAYWLLIIVASVLGWLITAPIGGADMPVVICLLNSYSGLAAAATGFVINNSVLIIAGSLVGASGIILTKIMCKAMNRSMVNVLFGIGAGDAGSTKADDVYAGKIKSAGPDELAMVLESGHMNVLLAEADVPYDKLKEMDAINPSFPQTDVAIVIGANDVVNPLARTDPKSPIAGMPILDVDKARTVIVVKRSLSPGFARIPNPLFAADNTLMYFADGKQAILDLIGALKSA